MYFIKRGEEGGKASFQMNCTSYCCQSWKAYVGKAEVCGRVAALPDTEAHAESVGNEIPHSGKLLSIHVPFSTCPHNGVCCSSPHHQQGCVYIVGPIHGLSVWGMTENPVKSSSVRSSFKQLASFTQDGWGGAGAWLLPLKLEKNFYKAPGVPWFLTPISHAKWLDLRYISPF